MVQTPSTLDEPQRTKRQAISAEPSALDPSKLTDVMLTSYLKTKEWVKETHKHTHTRARTEVTFECVCRSGELIQKALMNNDFMKHLEHGQVMTEPPPLSFLGPLSCELICSALQILTIMDCMYPTSLSKGCCVIQEGDDGSTVYVLEGKAGLDWGQRWGKKNPRHDGPFNSSIVIESVVYLDILHSDCSIMVSQPLLSWDATWW